MTTIRRRNRLETPADMHSISQDDPTCYPKQGISDTSDLAALFGREPVVTPASPVTEAALRYHGMGWNVIPLPYGEKHPDYSWASLKFTRLPADKLLLAFPDRCNIAVITGKHSDGLVALDADNERAYLLIWQWLRDQGLPIWATLSTRGGKVGHFFLYIAGGRVLANAKCALAPDQLGFIPVDADSPGAVDVLGHNRLAVLPPSLNGERRRSYEWAIQDPEGPPTVTLEQLSGLFPGLRLVGGSGGPSYGEKALQSECKAVAETLPGGRNEQLNRSAFAIGQLVASGVINRYDAEQALIQAARECRLDSREAIDTINRAFDAAENSPRRPSGNPATGNTWERARLLDWIANYDWPAHGRKAAGLRDIAAAMAERATTARNGKWRASERELAELARRSRLTTRAALTALQALGAIERAGNDHGSGATLWTIGPAVPRLERKDLAAAANALPLLLLQDKGTSQEQRDGYSEFDPLPTPVRFSGSNSEYLLANSDLAERGAFGPNGWRAWRYLLDQPRPMTTRAVATGLNITYKQAYYAIRRVIDRSTASGYPVIERAGDGWIAYPAASHGLAPLLERVTERGQGAENRRRRFETERANRAALIVIAAARKWPGYRVNGMRVTDQPAPATPPSRVVALKTLELVMASGRTTHPAQGGQGWLEQWAAR